MRAPVVHPDAFNGQTVLVTGAGRGIGAAIAKAFADAGAVVAVNDIDPEAAQRQARDIGGGAFSCPFDIANAQAVATAARERLKDGLDILVNNAAIEDITGFDDLTLDHWHRITRVNLDGALIVSKAFVPLMQDREGAAILNIASIQGVRGRQNALAYAAAKGGIVNLTRAMACDLALAGIRVNALAPGFIDTPMCIRDDGSHEYDEPWFQDVYVKHGRIPLGRAGTEDDVAGPALFLCSDAARYITGAVLMVDGGLSATF